MIELHTFRRCSERAADLPLLIQHFIERHAPRAQVFPASAETLQVMMTEYSWPGNIRELENVQ